MRSTTSRSITYAPALILFVGAGPRRLFEERLYRPVRVGRHNAVARGVPDGDERERRLRLLLLMEGELGCEVHVGEHVAIEDEEAIVEQTRIGRQAHWACRAEWLVLAYVAQANAVVLVAQHILHRVRQEAAREQHIVHAVALEPVEHEREKRAPGQWHYRLRHGVGQRPETGSLAAREYQRLHWISALRPRT
jgi:hypothetical protein